MQRCDSHAGMLANSTIEICSVTWPSEVWPVEERAREETRVLNWAPVSSFPASKLAVKISCQPISFVKKANKKTDELTPECGKWPSVLRLLKKSSVIYVELWLGYLLDDPGFECRRGQPSKRFRPALGPIRHPIRWVPVFTPGRQAPGPLIWLLIA